MNKPFFLCGTHEVEIEHPDSWNVVHDVSESVKESINKTLYADYNARKYQYGLFYNALVKSEFEALEDLYIYHKENSIPVQFTYEKWRESTSPVSVNMRLTDKGKVAGSGSVFYYVKLDIILTEILPR